MKESEAERDLLFRRLYDDHHLYVRKTLYWMLPRDPALDDLVQETFVKIWQNLSKFREESGLKTWIHRITVNVAYDYLKKARRRAAHEKQEVPHPIQSLQSPQSNLLLQQTLEEGLLAIPQQQRMVFVLYYQQEMEVAEIAEILRLPTGTVKSRLHHARSALTEFLNKRGVKP